MWRAATHMRAVSLFSTRSLSATAQPSSREAGSVGFNSRVNRRQCVQMDKEVDRKKIFSLARATNLSSLSGLPVSLHDLLIYHLMVPPRHLENTILLESLVSGVRACARAYSELESRGQILSARSKSRTELSFWTKNPRSRGENFVRGQTRNAEMWATKISFLIAGRRRKTASQGWIAAYILQVSKSHPWRHPKTATTCPHWWWVLDHICGLFIFED